MEPITEKLSEKPKRGRPRHPRYTMGHFVGDGHFRTARHVRNAIHWGAFAAAVMTAGPDAETAIFGGTGPTRPRSLPAGFKQAAQEANRYIEFLGGSEGDEQDVVQQVIGARIDEVPWRDIAAHYRELRLGPKEGNTSALLAVLSRAFDDYMRNFPSTTPTAQTDAIQALLHIVTDMQGDITT